MLGNGSVLGVGTKMFNLVSLFGWQNKHQNVNICLIHEIPFQFFLELVTGWLTLADDPGNSKTIDIWKAARHSSS